MYCAKCASPLQETHAGALVCPRGLEYSLHLSRLLRETCTAPDQPTKTPTARRFEHDEPQVLYCPGCGAALSDGADQACPTCGVKPPKRLWYPMVEVHPHPDGRGGHFQATAPK